VTGFAPGKGPFRILVVDDVRDNRELLCTMLQPIGFQVREATNGEEALTVFDDWSPHAVLMDMRMPVMDGYEATRRIKALEAGRDTPVFAVTAGAFKDSEQEVLATGVSAYLRKPFQAEEVLARVRTHLILRRMQRELERHNLIFSGYNGFGGTVDRNQI
jgi:CheY-like chemotaxis protein